MVSAPWASKLMADLGADVIKVEPPGGDRARHRGPYRGAPDPESSGLFTYLNTNKRSLVADVQTSEGRERVAELLRSADLLVHNLEPTDAASAGFEPSSLRAEHPSAVGK